MNKITNPHIVSAFSKELNALSDDILRMGGIAELMVRDARTAALKGDEDTASDIIARDQELDSLEHELGRKIVLVLALRQPMASDLRAALAALKTAHNLERIGDLAKNIARRTHLNARKLSPSLLTGLDRLGSEISQRLHTVLDAFAMGDTERAISVWSSDDEIDLFHNSLLGETLRDMQGDQDNIEAGANLMFIVKNFERIGDHCTNIAEEIHYKETGEVLVRPQATRPYIG